MDIIVPCRARAVSRWASHGRRFPARCSKSFQKFAVKSNASVGELLKKTAEHKDRLGGQGGEFFKVFKEEVRPGLCGLGKAGLLTGTFQPGHSLPLTLQPCVLVAALKGHDGPSEEEWRQVASRMSECQEGGCCARPPTHVLL